MKHRVFGDARVSEVGLGCWQIGGDQWGDVPDTDALDVLRASAEAGVTFLDTADVYGAGRSEELIGRFLKNYKREQFFIASKFGRFPRPGWPGNFAPKTIREHTENSLKRLGIERLDLTQLHCLPMEQLKRAEVDTLALKKGRQDSRFGAALSRWRSGVREARTRVAKSSTTSSAKRPRRAVCSTDARKGIAIIVRLPPPVCSRGSTRLRPPLAQPITAPSTATARSSTSVKRSPVSASRRGLRWSRS